MPSFDAVPEEIDISLLLTGDRLDQSETIEVDQISWKWNLFCQW